MSVASTTVAKIETVRTSSSLLEVPDVSLAGATVAALTTA
jgi:hypothetical protein